jgi:hypothetical protein
MIYMLPFVKFLHVTAFPNNREGMIFVVLQPETLFIELMQDKTCMKKLFLPIFVTFKERLDKSERLAGI